MAPVVLLTIFLLDQLSKFLILKTLSFGDSVPVIPRIFHLTLVRNTGIAFGLLQGWSHLLVWMNLGLLSAFLLLIVLRRFFKKPLLQIGVGMIAGGGLGNLLDRFRFGYIVDFLDFRIWPVFNLADSAICIGTFLLLLALFRPSRKE